MLLEGVFDALVVGQAAGDLITPVATLSTHGARRAKWLIALSLAKGVLVSFDADESGRSASEWWESRLQGARPWRPFFGDPSDMWRVGGDELVRRWVLAGLGLPTEEDAINDYLERLALCLESRVAVPRAHAMASIDTAEAA